MRISDWSSDVCSSDLRAGIDRERIAAALGIGAGDFADQPAKRNDAARHRSGHPAGGFLALFSAILVDLLVDIGDQPGVEFVPLPGDPGELRIAAWWAKVWRDVLESVVAVCLKK